MTEVSPTPRERWPARAGLILLLLLGALYALASIFDLAATVHGLPADHQRTFSTLTGTTFTRLAAGSPGVAAYVTLLERGYALHELTFAILFLALIAIPFRRRRPWAWWAAWTPTIANLGYTLTFGTHDPAILLRALTIDIALPALLLAHAPAFLHTTRRRSAR